MEKPELCFRIEQDMLIARHPLLDKEVVISKNSIYSASILLTPFKGLRLVLTSNYHELRQFEPLSNVPNSGIEIDSFVTNEFGYPQIILTGEFHQSVNEFRRWSLSDYEKARIESLGYKYCGE